MKSLYVLILIFFSLFLTHPAYAITNPLDAPNNKFGIHIISPSNDEIIPAAELVNSNGGDWGYVTIIIRRNEMDKDKWQGFFNELRRRHLIPIVRIASEPENSHWKRPDPEDADRWANFLDSLVWPIQNRYVTIYNEPNHSGEWGGSVDPRHYAVSLNKTIDTLKSKSSDFFVLNAGLDASSPQELPNYMDEQEFLKQMNDEVPGIFNKLDGWVSHSYPNPGFVGSPNDTGRKSIRTFNWELQILRSLGLTKDLPIFITETGWKHSEGITKNPSLPSPETVGEYFKNAFNNAWSTNRVVAVTPFLLSYQEAPFVNFSFKKYQGKPQDVKLLGVQYPDYHPHYNAIANLPKLSGQPAQITKTSLIEGSIYHTIVLNEIYNFRLTFKNTGQSIWNDKEKLELKILNGEKELGLKLLEPIDNKKIEPGETITYYLSMRATNGGVYNASLDLLLGNKPIENARFDFSTEVKSPVVLTVKSTLKWKNNFAGEYLLKAVNSLSEVAQKLNLSPAGQSDRIEARYLLPDNEYDFTLSKPHYKPKNLRQTVQSGENLLDFGELEPSLSSAILKPAILWSLLPFSN